MSLVDALLPELCREIAACLGMGDRHAFARTCRFLLNEDRGESTRLPEAWMARLRRYASYPTIHNAYRDLMWYLHARGVAHWACEREWEFDYWDDHAFPSQQFWITVEMPSRHDWYRVEFHACWSQAYANREYMLAGRIYVSANLKVPRPDTEFNGFEEPWRCRLATGNVDEIVEPFFMETARWVACLPSDDDDKNDD